MKQSGKHPYASQSAKILQQENDYLKQIINNYLPGFTIKENAYLLTEESTIPDKIKTFCELFRGRSDVFAKRWEANNGKSGYAPATLNKKYLPLTNQTIYDHLSGKYVVGLYPMLSNNSCWLLVVDFDKMNWQEDVQAFTNTCSKVQIPFSIERSRSGNGAHVWIFFSEAIPASLARKLGNALLEETIKSHHNLDSYDRIFPSQDHLASVESLGNLIALPLQRHARSNNNSVFVNINFLPYDDQWMYLSTIIKINKETVQRALRILALPMYTYSTNESPVQITATKKNGIHFELSTLSEQLIIKLTELATFSNPEFYKAKAKRHSTHHIQSRIECFDKNASLLILPRGCEEAVQEMLDANNIHCEWEDERYSGYLIEAEFHGALTSQQQEALDQLLSKNIGVLAAATGFGKTVTAAALIAERKVNTLIIVNRLQLQTQWIEQLSRFLKIPPKEIGKIGGGKQSATGRIDVAMIQTLTSQGIDSIITQYGQVIVDECHHVSAYTSEQLMKMIRAKYVYGLTATPERKDGLHPIITMQCGPIVYRTDAKTQSLVRPFHHFLQTRNTNYQTKSENIQHMYNELADDSRRNQLIFDDVLLALEEGLTPLILTERVNHVTILAEMFRGFAKNIVVLTGKLTKKEQNVALRKLQEITDQEELLIIATGKYIGEGFDCPRLNALFLAMPFSWKGILHQYVGRLHREHTDKEEVRVYDYIDRKVPALLRMSQKRAIGFRKMGYLNRDDKENAAEQMKLF